MPADLKLKTEPGQVGTGVATVTQLNEFAVACRVAKVMRPYLEAMQ